MEKLRLALIGLVSFSGFCVSLTAQAEPTPSFHYWARVPAASLSCQEEAAALSARFARATGLIVTEAVCLGTSSLSSDGRAFLLHSLELTYLSENEAVPYVATFGSGERSEPLDSIGAYATMAECLQDLPAQTALFETQTELAAVSATCDRNTYPFSQSAVLKIAGFGKPTRRLFSVEFKFHGVADASFKQQAKDVLTRRGAYIAREVGENVLFYSPEFIPARVHRFATFEQASYCQAQLSELRSILLVNGAKSVVLDCLAHSDALLPQASVLEGVEDSGAFLSSDFGYESPRYYSFDECMGDRARVLRRAVDRGRTPLGGICRSTRFNSGEFNFEMFRKL